MNYISLKQAIDQREKYIPLATLFSVIWVTSKSAHKNIKPFKIYEKIAVFLDYIVLGKYHSLNYLL